MKAYPKLEKEVACFECEEPILSRDDLLFTTDKLSPYKYKLVPIHMSCLGSLSKQIGKEIKLESSETFLEEINQKILFWSIVIFILNLILLLISFNWFHDVVIGSLVGILFITGLFSYHMFTERTKSKFIWNEFEKHLPTTCEQCTKTIPPGKRTCACGWKYGQSVSKSKRKLKH